MTNTLPKTAEGLADYIRFTDQSIVSTETEIKDTLDTIKEKSHRLVVEFEFGRFSGSLGLERLVYSLDVLNERLQQLHARRKNLQYLLDTTK